MRFQAECLLLSIEPVHSIRCKLACTPIVNSDQTVSYWSLPWALSGSQGSNGFSGRNLRLIGLCRFKSLLYAHANLH